MHFYIHIPFCRQKCPYCKFALTPIFNEAKKKRYIAHLKNEILSSLRKELSKGNEDGGLFIGNSKTPIPPSLRDTPLSQEGSQTIYFGGGTPSILSHDEIREILECFPNPPYPPCQEGFIEITLEANPEDITEEYISGIFDLGINRLSIGIQTLNNQTLTEIHRSDSENIYGALESVKNSLGGNQRNNDISVNIDFILGLPYTKKGETLEGIKELHKNFPFITHTSVYMLEDEKYPKNWKENSISENEMQEEFLEIIEYFESLGWCHYELSNWAKPGYESIHNQSYWDHSSFRGFGLSASSYEDGIRFTNASSFSGYYEGKKEDEEILTHEQIQIEKMMFGLRRGGLDISAAAFLGINEEKIKPLISTGVIEKVDEKIRPTKTGIFLLDHIMSELIS